MKNKLLNQKIIILFTLISIILFIFPMVSAYTQASSRYTQPGMSSYNYLKGQGIDIFPMLDKEKCGAGQDFILQISPEGCTPSVVRSDLLEEQNVPVFCPIMATKINPLIDVEAITNMNFRGDYSREISGIGFHPSQAALSSGYRTMLNSPVLDNIGYAVIVIKKQKNESSMPDYVEGTVTANIKYDITNALGTGRSVYYLPVLDDNQWNNNYQQYSFWKGKGYLRADSVGINDARISVYRDQDTRLSGKNLVEGQTSDMIYIPGYYCLAGMELKLNGLESYDTYAKLNIDGEYYEVKDGERFLDNKCEIRDIQKQGLNEKTKIYCDVDEGQKNFELSIRPKVLLQICDEDGVSNCEEKEVTIGESIGRSNNQDKQIFLGAAYTKGDTGNLEDLRVYFLKSPEKSETLSASDINAVYGYANNFEFKEPTNIGIVDVGLGVFKVSFGAGSAVYNWLIDGESFAFLRYQDKAKIFGKQITLLGLSTASNRDIGKDFETSYAKAIEDYQKIIDQFPGEKIGATDDTYAENALLEIIDMAYSGEQIKDLKEFCEEFKEKYSDSVKVNDYCNNVIFANSESSVTDVLVDGSLKVFSFSGIREPSPDEYGAVVYVSGAGEGYNGEKILRKNQRIYLNDAGDFFELSKVDDDSIQIAVTVDTNIFKNQDKNVKIDLNSYAVLANKYEIKLTKINLQKVAKVSIIPNIRYTETTANFSFKIGIEQRAIKLTPEETQSRINKLDDQIEKWDDISGKLGDTVQALNKVCLGTGAYLTAKNFLSNFQGEALARQKVMRSSGGWYDYCAKQVSLGKYTTTDSCLLDKADDIDKDVGTMTNIMNYQNEKLKSIQTYEKAPLGGDVVNEEKLVNDYSNIVKQGLPVNLGEGIDREKIIASLNSQNYKDGNFYKDDLRDIDLYSQVLSSSTASPELKLIAQNGLTATLTRIQTNSQSTLELQTVSDFWGGMGFSDVKTKSYGSKNSEVAVYNRVTASAGNKIGITAGTPIESITFDSVKYMLELESIDTDKYIIKNIYGSDGKIIGDGDITKEIMKTFSKGFQDFDQTSYRNPYLNPELKYFETGQFKGYPAIVPFDKKNGWYAATRQTLPGLGNIRTYDESGRVASFWIGNVGENKREQFNEQTSDDIIMQFNPGTGEIYGTFPGLDASETRRLVQDAVNAIEEAQRAHKPGVKSVKINNVAYNVGKPAVNVPEVQCQDFMSPKDCNLLFNVCDPVVCPSSRCNLGGNYYVEDVIQSGIIGSIALCLPNYREGIIMPVCLSGVNAGVESLLSVTKSYRDCLQESLDTGKQVGVCDYVNSVYLCEFFWRQAAPFAKAGIPTLLSWISGQGTRGGGEYMSLASAWDNAASSVDYFVDYYGANSYKFKARDTTEVGSEVCKNFLSTKYPSSGDFIDALTTPESPVQYTAWFEEIPFTTATNPPISQYKVFYHIYAGKDIGSYYKVYLKSPSGASLYQDNPTIMVNQGYLGGGDYATETIDLTAASGYKELCVNVNSQEKCGFKQVSTSFVPDYIAAEYIKEQTTQEVSSEAECVSGSPSWYGLLNPNMEEGVSEALNPELYNKGIVRVCSSLNPGQGTDEARWIKTGYCSNKNIGCWLDSQSVEDTVKIDSTKNEILGETTQSYLDALRQEGDYYTEEQSNSAIINLRKIVGKVIGEGTIDNVELSNAIKNITNAYAKVLMSNEKVQLLDLRARAYNKIARNFKKVFDDKKITEQVIKTEAQTEAEAIFYQSPPGQVYPIFEYKDGTMQKNLFFTYDDSGWTWSPNKESQGPIYPLSGVNWRSVENTQASDISLNKGQLYLLDSLSKLNTYQEGLSFLIVQTFLGDGTLWFNPVLSTDDADLSHDRIFTLKQGIIIKNDIYFRYNQNNMEWEWSNSLSQDRWTSVSEVELEYSVYQVNSAYTGSGFWKNVKTEASGRAKELITQLNILKGKPFIEGAKVIFSVNTLIEGEVVGSDRVDVDYDFESKDVAQMIEAINYAKANSIDGRKCNCGENCASYAKLLVDASNSNNIPDALLLLSILMQESNCEPAASSSSSTGLMQINCNVHKGSFGLPADKNECEKQLLANPKLNIETGAKILKKYYDTYKKGKLFNGCSKRGITYYEWEAAVRAYNGWGCNTDYPQQDFYVDEVMKRYKTLSGLFS